jgi:two-component system NtrC family sensor kinase
MKISLLPALLLLLAGVLLVAFVPAGLMLGERLEAELERAAREQLTVAPRVIGDRNLARSDALMMHAKDLAASPALIAAFRAGDAEGAVRAAEAARIDERELIVVVPAPGDAAWAGPMPGGGLIEATRAGEMPVSFLPAESGPAQVALAPVVDGARWLGAAGVYEPLDATGAAALAGLTRSEVLVALEDGTVTASTLADGTAAAIAAAYGDRTEVEEVVLADGSRWWVACAPLEEAGRVLFARSAESALAVLPRLRRGALFSLGLALLFALLLGTLAAGAAARPVGALAEASGRLAGGDFAAPVPRSALSDVDRVARGFREMRDALARRLEELEAANRELAEQQERLQALQGELIQRDRLAASGRLVAELAHEIRNPVASIRNCLEVLDRRLAEDPEGRVFSELAIGELARMHELAEGLLDLNRPLDPEASRCDATEVAGQVAALMAAGRQGERWPISIERPSAGLEAGTTGTDGGSLPTAIAPEALKQVLINLVQNAQESMPEGGPIAVALEAHPDRTAIEVSDRGPGIPPEILPRIFDPFFTTKGEVSGVGLGLFVAEGVVRRYGGVLSARNRDEGAGAVFRVELPAETVEGEADEGPAPAEVS